MSHQKHFGTGWHLHYPNRIEEQQWKKPRKWVAGLHFVHSFADSYFQNTIIDKTSSLKLYKSQQLRTDFIISWCFSEVGNFYSLIMQKTLNKINDICEQNHPTWPWSSLWENPFCKSHFSMFQKVINTLSLDPLLWTTDLLSSSSKETSRTNHVSVQNDDAYTAFYILLLARRQKIKVPRRDHGHNSQERAHSSTRGLPTCSHSWSVSEHHWGMNCSGAAQQAALKAFTS